VRQAEAEGARCLTVPRIAEVVAGRVSVNALREVELEDLLRRAPARIDLDSVAGSFKDRTVLITGAGGSIGSELARQIVRFGPRRLVLLGRGENSIFEAMHSMAVSYQTATVSPVILDIRDRARLLRLFGEVRPDVVFHAAAHKHVPFMEQFPDEAIAANVVGTANVIDAATRSGVDRFVFISTDKAVNPTSVMGATKRIGELLIREVARETGARYVTVRFGNVLSSRGSVVPLFRQQLARGEPLTITDRDAQRFFMTIPEAVQLVLQAAALAEPGDTFVLDMGDPVLRPTPRGSGGDW
jgi:FlaA1/EpsC-like NDP-sugar epimerase